MSGIATTYSRGKLLLSIVERHSGDKIVAAAKSAGAGGGTIALGRGTAETSLGQILGIGDTEKDVVLTLAADEQVARIVEALRSYAQGRRHALGVLLLIDVSQILKHVMPDRASAGARTAAATRRSTVKTKADHALIALIVNRGCADDAMVAARKAGAKGGTILNARGTGKEEDVKFFGITLVPEKEILLILVETVIADKVLQAVKEVPFLSEPGAGIAFCVDVEGFWSLERAKG